MSVETTADKHVDEARYLIRDAIDELKNVVVDQCWGHDEFCNEARNAQREVFIQLMSLRDRLGEPVRIRNRE